MNEQKAEKLRTLIFKIRLASEEIAKCNMVVDFPDDQKAIDNHAKATADAYSSYFKAEERLVGFVEGVCS